MSTLPSFAELLRLPRAPSPLDPHHHAPVCLAATTSPADWAAQRLGFHPDPVQTEILDSDDPALILLCTRQYGKTTLTAIKALHFALSHPDTLTVVAAPTERRSGEWFRVLGSFLALLDLPLKGDRIHSYSAVLPNRSRLIGLPGTIDTNRGYPAHLLIVDEAAFVPDQVYSVLTPSLAATNGAQWLISSAGPESGFLYRQWRETQIPWRRFMVAADQCPRISPEFLARERLLLGEKAFQQEFFCQFQPGASHPITRDLLEAALDAGYDPLNHGEPFWHDLCTR